MNAHISNKKAWEESFNNRRSEWGIDIVTKYESESFPFLETVLIDELKNYDFQYKTIAQLCCNNGRELLSLMQTGAEKGFGFDIAENMVEFANEKSKELHLNCEFIASDIYCIDSSFNQTFDAIFITIGALTWFESLDNFFAVVSRTLKPNGFVFINECHPLTNMLAMSDEEEFDPDDRKRLVHSYFKQEPWIESDGMGYFSDNTKKHVETFTSYSHTLDTIIMAMITNGLQITRYKEIDVDISNSFSELNQQGFPLSYLLVALRR